MIILGSALPIAVWGAADEIGAEPPPEEMTNDMMGWGFRF